MHYFLKLFGAFAAVLLTSFLLFNANALADTPGGNGSGGNGGGNGSGQGQGSGQRPAPRVYNFSVNRGGNGGGSNNRGGNSGNTGGGGGDGDDMRDRNRRDNEQRETAQREQARVESAVTFNLTLGKWCDDNKELLPAEIPEILKRSATENFESASAKAAELRSAIILSFFDLQENEDLLTASQKASLANYKKLSRTAKIEKAADFYETIFEPTFESLRKIRRAQDLNAGGQSSQNTALRDRLIKQGQEVYLKKRA